MKNQAPLLTLQYLSQSSLRNIFLASEQPLPDQTYKIFFDILILHTEQAKIWMKTLQMSQFGDMDSGSRKKYDQTSPNIHFYLHKQTTLEESLCLLHCHHSADPAIHIKAKTPSSILNDSICMIQSLEIKQPHQKSDETPSLPSYQDPSWESFL